MAPTTTTIENMSTNVKHLILWFIASIGASLIGWYVYRLLRGQRGGNTYAQAGSNRSGSGQPANAGVVSAYVGMPSTSD